MAAAVRRWLILAQFVGLSLVVGSGFLFMTVALEGLSYAQVAWARALLGAAALLVAVGLSRQLVLPTGAATWGHVGVLAVTNLAIPYVLFAWAQQHISSGLGSVYNATGPLMTAVIAGVARIERLRGLQIAGIVLGLVGVVLIMAPWAQGPLAVDLHGSLVALAAVASIAFSFVYTRKFIPPSELPGASLSVLVACGTAIVMLALTPVMALSPVQLTWHVAIGILVLGVLHSGLGVMLSLNIIHALGPSRAATSMYLAPVVGMVLGVVVLDESVAVHQLVGAAITLIALFFVRPRTPTPGQADSSATARISTNDVVTAQRPSHKGFTG